MKLVLNKVLSIIISCLVITNFFSIVVVTQEDTSVEMMEESSYNIEEEGTTVNVENENQEIEEASEANEASSDMAKETKIEEVWENKSVAEIDPNNLKGTVNFEGLHLSKEPIETFSRAGTTQFLYSTKRGGTFDIFNNETLVRHSYIHAIGYLMEYLGVNAKDNNYFDVRFQGGVYALHKNDVEVFIPLDKIKSFPYYVNIGGKVKHYIEADPTISDSWYFNSELGDAPNWMVENKKYYSFSGIYFTDSINNLGQYVQQTNAVNKNSPYYDYYLYQPLRTKTSYSAEQLNQAFNYFYSKSSAQGKTTILNNAGTALIDAQEKYGTNALIVLSLGIHEGNYGTSDISIKKNNPFGYAAYDSNTGAAKAFANVTEAINYVSGDYLSWVHADAHTQSGSNYYGSHLGNKASGINVKYASDPFWGEKNANFYAQIDRYLGGDDYQKYGLSIAAQGEAVYRNSNGTNLAHTYKNSTSLLTYMYPVVTYNNNEWTEIALEPPYDVNGNVDYYGRYNWSSRGYVKKSNMIKISDAKGTGLPENPNIITVGDVTFYLNNDKTIKYAEKKSQNKTKEVWTYYGKTVYGDSHENKLKFVMKLNELGEIVETDVKALSTGKNKAHYTYYQGAIFNKNHETKIKFKYNINQNGNVVSGELMKNNSTNVRSYITYYANAVYGKNHLTKIKFKYNIDELGKLTSSELMRDNTTNMRSYYTYYANAIYGTNHLTKIKFKYNMDTNGKLTSSELMQNNSTNVRSLYTYYVNAVYGKNHLTKIKYRYNINDVGNITSSELMRNNTTQVRSYYTYYEGAVYGTNHLIKIKSKYNVDTKNYLTTSEVFENDSNKVIKIYKYYPKTVYGNHSDKVESIIYP